jgi:hypothetical protein
MPTYLIAALRARGTEIGETLKVYPTLGVAAVGSTSFIVSPDRRVPEYIERILLEEKRARKAVD